MNQPATSSVTRAEPVSLIVLVILLFSAGGCRGLGARTVPGDRLDFNRAGSASSNEQLLLNLVRMHLGRPVYFVEIETMISQYRLAAGGIASDRQTDLHGSFGPALRAAFPTTGDPVPDASSTSTWRGNLGFAERPTIVYQPVVGREFSSGMLLPISPSTIAYLAQSAWSVGRLLACCVQEINGIPNQALQDRGETSRDTSRFQRLIHLFALLQDRGYVRFSVEPELDTAATYVYLPEKAPGLDNELSELKGLLNCPSGAATRLCVTSNSVRHSPDELSIQTRSVYAMMQALAEEGFGAPPPAKHQDASEAENIPAQAPEQWLRINHSLLPRQDAFVQVHYDGRWYSISKDDWNSKRTFALLTCLFSMQTSQNKNSETLSSVSAGK